MSNVTLHVGHKFPVSFLLYIATKKTCQINQINTVNSSLNAPISDTSQKKTLLHNLLFLILTIDLKIIKKWYSKELWNES